jgi:hypothetical protein
MLAGQVVLASACTGGRERPLAPGGAHQPDPAAVGSQVSASPPAPRDEASASIALGVRYGRGSPLRLDASPPVGPGVGLPGDALVAQVAVWGLRAAPALSDSLPLSERTRQLVRSLDGQALASGASLLRGARWALIPAPGGVGDVGNQLGAGAAAQPPHRLRGVLPVGISAGFEVRLQPTASLADEAAEPEGARLLARRLGGRLLEVGLELLCHTHRSAQDALGLPECELAWLDPLELPVETALVLIVPSPPAHSAGWGLAVAFWASPAPSPGSPPARAHLEAFSACVATLDSSVAQHDLAPLPLRKVPPPDVEAGPLGRLGSRRGAVLATASGSGARLTADLARSASEQVLEAVARRVHASGVALRAGPELGLALETAALGVLLDQEPLAPALRAVLLRYAGGAAGERRWLREAAGGAASPDELLASLRAENRLLLRDASPAVRWRAHRWLAAREAAVLGYDPLAPRRARRAALRAASDEGPR